MTDELSRGLAELGEEIYVITPWYEDKNKANPKALEKDKIFYKFNIEIFFGDEK